MRLIRVHLTDFAGVGDREVRFAESGVTVVEGPNESGKTTLLKAFDLLLNYRDASSDRRVEVVRPAGTGLGPTVEAEFVTQGHHVRYRKRWLSQPHTEVEIRHPDGRVQRARGREAHDAVKELLDATLDWGLWDALQVQQGTSLELPAFGGSMSLKDALNQAASGNLGGELEDDLFRRVQAERDRYLSRKGKIGSTNEKGPLQTARQDDARARTALAQAREAAEAAEETARRLGDDRQRLNQFGQDRTAANAELEEAERAMKGLQKAQHRVSELGQEAQRAQLRLGNNHLRLNARTDLVQRTAKAGTQAEKLRSDLEEARSASAAAQRLVGSSQEKYEAAQTALTDAQEAARRTEADRDELLRQADIAPLEGRLERAQATESEIAKVKSEIAGLLVGDDELSQIEGLHTAATQARAKLEAGAARLRITAKRDLALEVDGADASLNSGESLERIASRAIRVEVPDVLSLEIEGGGDAADLARRAETAQGEIAQALQACGVGSVEGAREVNRRLTGQRVQLTGLERELEQALAGETPALIESRVAQIKAQSEAFQEARRRLEAPMPVDLAATQEEATEVRAALDSATRERDIAANELHRLETAKAAADEKASVLADQLEQAEGELKSAKHEIEKAREEVSDADLELAVQEGAAQLAKAQDALTEAERDLQALNPDRIEADHTSAKGRVERLENEIGDLRQAVARAEGQLKQITLEGAGLAERLAIAESDAEKAAANLAAVERRARAADLLHATLLRHLETALRAYREPYRQEVEHLGRIVFGNGFAVDLDDDLRIAARTLGGVTLPAAQLSSGAREQLGVIGRLACARLVSGEGVPVVLDDAFSYSDPERIKGICRALDRAGGNGQVVVLTCDPDRYRDLGAATVLRLKQGAPVTTVPGVAEPQPEPAVDIPTPAAAETPAAYGGEDRVLLALRIAPTPLGKREILATAQIPESEWTRTIKALLDSGLVEQIGERRGAMYRPRDEWRQKAPPL